MIFTPFAFRKPQGEEIIPGFTPNDISDLTFWVDFSDSNFYTTSGTDITQVYSKVGGSTSHTLNRVNASNSYYTLADSLSNPSLKSAKVTARPTSYQASSWNTADNNAIVFGPKTDTTSYPNGTMICVYNRGTISTAGYLISRYNGTTDRGVQYNLTTGTPYTDIIGYDYNSPAYQYYDTINSNNVILTRVNNSTTSTIYNGKTQVDSGAKNDTQNRTTRQFHNLGIWGSPTVATDSAPVNTQYCEVIIYNRVLTSEELDSVWNYLSDKWNIPIIPTEPVSTDRVLYYDMGNTSSYPGTGTSISNLDATSLTSTMTNGASYSSDNGGLVVFDGTNDYTTGADNAIIDFGTGDFTIEVWFKINGDSNLNASNQRSAALITAINKSGTLNGWNLTLRGNSTTTGTSIVLEAQVNGTGQYPDYTFPATLSKNTLYQIGVSHSSTNGTKFIFNGTNNAASSNLSQAVNGNFALELGRLGITNYLHYLNGGISTVRIYKGRQLSDAEVLQNWQYDWSRRH